MENFNHSLLGVYSKSKYKNYGEKYIMKSTMGFYTVRACSPKDNPGK